MNVSEIFFSLNGEGLLTGVPTIFVRLSGCNLRCAWCDTQYAWEKGTEMTVKAVIEKVRECDNEFCSWVLITGGEPLLQDIYELVNHLHDEYKISIETNGTLYSDVLTRCDFISVDIKPPSSTNPTTNVTSFKKIVDTIKKRDGQVKAVIADRNDYDFVYRFVEDSKITVPVILQPCWGTMGYNQLCRMYFDHPLPTKSIRVLTQLHKTGDIK
jgi:7-carboxy-7-deazaguanine synthase